MIATAALPATSTRHARIGRRLAATAGMLVLFVGLTFTNDAFVHPVAAAGASNKPDISACFRWGSVAYANEPVFLAAYYSGEGWKTTRSAKTNASGCVRFNDITVHRYYAIVALKTWPELCYYYHGETPQIYTSTATDRVYAMGTFYMYSAWWC